MFSSWKPLRRFHLAAGTTIDQPNEEVARQVTPESPVMEIADDPRAQTFVELKSELR